MKQSLLLVRQCRSLEPRPLPPLQHCLWGGPKGHKKHPGIRLPLAAIFRSTCKCLFLRQEGGFSSPGPVDLPAAPGITAGEAGL